MLSEKIINECKTIEASKKEYDKYDRPAQRIVLIGLVILVSSFVLPEVLPLSIHDVLYVSGGIIFIFLLCVYSLLQTKAREFRVTKSSENKLYVYLTLKLIEENQKYDFHLYIDRARSNIRSFISNL